MPSKPPAPITIDAVYAAPGYLFRRMQQIAVSIFMEECKPFDLTPVQYAALIAIHTQSITLPSIGSVLVGDADTQMVGKLGIDSQQNQALLKTADTIRQQAEDDWKATSGVNQDEEAVNLMEFQKMYQANMKAIAVANELFDATLRMF